MDYHSLKRKELQALCKEHNIPANSANSVLADKLSALLNEKPKQKTRQRTCMKSPAETADEGEPVELKRQAKKVRFSPNNDLVEYEQRPGEKQKEVVTQTKTRRKSMAKKVDDNDATVELNDDSEQIPFKATRSRVQSSAKEVVSTNNEKKKGRRGAKNVEKETVVDKETGVNVGKVTRSKAKGGNLIDDNNTAVELNDDSGQIPVKVTRSRVQSSAKEVVSTNNQKKKGRRGAKDVEKETVVDKEAEVNVGKVTRSKAKEVNEETETVEGTMAARVRVTRGKAQTLMEGGTVSDANPKKKSGKQVKSVEQNVEPSDVPVRATRSRRQTIKGDIENTVTNNTQTDKKRTRREMKATDSSNNSSEVALVDKQETRKRKSFRTRGAETVVEDESDIKEMANKSRVTRSKAPLAKETSGRNKNKASKVEIQQPVEPLKHEGKKNVNRRKSVLQTEKIEEAVNHPTRTNTRQKSVVQKASKTVEPPTVGNNQPKGLSGSFEDKEVTNGTPRSLKQRQTPIKEDRIIESPKRSTRSASRSEGNFVAETPKSKRRTPIIEDPIIEKSPKSSTHSASRSEGKSVAETPKSGQRRASIIEDSITDKSQKSSTRSASRSEGKSVAETPKSRKRKGTPIIEDPFIEKSTKSSTRGASKSEGKSVAKKQVESSFKKPMSKGRSSAVRSGATVHDSRSKKKAKLSEARQTDSEDHIANSGKECTPAAKMKNLKLEEVNEAEVPPAIDKSGRRFTRSTIKGQPIAEAQLFSPKAAQFRHDPAVNTAPVRITRRGVKHDGNAAGSFSEAVKKKQTRQSAHKKPFDDAEVASPKVTEARPTTGVGNIEVQSEVKQPDAQVQMSSPEVAEAGGVTSDVGTTGDQAEVKQPLDEVQTSAPEVEEVVVNPDVDTVGAQSEVEEPLDDVQMSSPEVAEVQPSSDGDTIAEVKQPLDDDQMSAPEVAEVVVNPDVDTVGVQSEVKQPLDDVHKHPLDDVQISSPEVAEVQPNLDGDTIAEVKQPLDEVQISAPEVAEGGDNPDVDTIGVQSEVEEPLDDVQMSSPEVTEVQPNLDGDTIAEVKQPLDEVQMSAPEVAEVGVNPDVNTIGVQSEVEEPLDDIQMSSPEVAEVQPNSDVNLDALLTEDVNLEISALKSERPDAREKEMHSTESGSSLKGMKNDVMIEEPLVSVGKTVVVEEAVDNNCDSPLQIFSADRHDVADEGEQNDDDESASAQKTLTPEPDSRYRVDVQENPFSGNGGGECDNAVSDKRPRVDMLGTPMIGKGAVQDADINVSQELETGSELPNANKNVDIDIDIDIERVLDGNSDVQDGESEHNQSTNNDSLSERNQLASNDSLAIDVDVEDDNSVPAQNANVPVVDEVLVKSCEQEPDVPCDAVRQSDLVDAPEVDTIVSVGALDESAVDKNKDAVSSMLSNTDDMDNEGDDENKQNLFEFDEGFQPNESKGISSDVRIEQTKEEVETSRGNSLTLDDEQATTTCDDLDSDDIMEGGSHIKAHEDPTREEASRISYTKGESAIVGANSSQLTGDVGAHESLIRQESFQMTYKKEESLVNDTESDMPTIMEIDRTKQDEPRSTGTSVDWGDYDLAMDEPEEPVLANGGADAEGKGKTDVHDSDFQASARTSSIEDSSARNADDGNSNQDNILKEYSNSADMTDDFNWSGTPFKFMFKTPGATRTDNTGDGHDDAAKLANQDNYSSLKSLFATPGTSKTSHINDNKSDAVNSTFSDSRGNEDIGSSRTEAHQFNHQWDNSLSKDFDGVTQGDAVRDTSFDDYSEFFEDEVEGSFETKQPELSNKAAETSHHDHPSGSKDNSTCQFEKEVTQTKVPKADDGLSFDTGHA